MRATRLAFLPILLGATVGLSAPACATPMGAAAQVGQEGPTVSVAVENRADTGTHVYVLQEGHMVPLGYVEAGASETLTVPPAAIESGQGIRLVADAVASTDWYQSDPVSIDTGSEVAFTIESDLDRSTVTVRD